MSQQINLYDATLRRRREWLTAAHLAAACGLLLAALGGWGTSARSEAQSLESEAAALAPRVKALQEQVQAMDKAIAVRKPDPRLEEELVAQRAFLATRSEVLDILKKGLGAEAAGFAEYLRGLARQTPSGLWLTGFSVASDGSAMEIRGRTLDPSLLPDYIQRLNAEKAFRGQAFSALQLKAGGAPGPAAAEQAGAPAPGVDKAAAPAVRFHEFTLVPVKAAEQRP